MGLLNFITRNKEREEIEKLSESLRQEKKINCAAQKSMCGELYKFVGCFASPHKVEILALPDLRSRNEKRH